MASSQTGDVVPMHRVPRVGRSGASVGRPERTRGGPALGPQRLDGSERPAFRAKEGPGLSSLLSAGGREEARLPCRRGEPRASRRPSRPCARPHLAPVGGSKPQANPPRTRGTDLDLLARALRSSLAQKAGKAERGGCSKLPVIRRRVRSAPVPLAAAGISSARAGRGSGGRVAGSRLRSALASGRRPTRRRRETLRAACRRPLGRGPRLP
jgi:hypothetical protein